MTLLQEIRRRWRAESPKFWKKIRNIWITVGGVCVTIYMLEKAQIDFIRESLPIEWQDEFDKGIRMITVMAIVGVFQAKITVKNPDDLARPGDSSNPSM